MMGARETVLGMIDGAWTTQVIAAACELKVFDVLAQEERDAAALAKALEADADSVERLAKALCVLGLCERTGAGRFAIAAQAQCLRSDAPGSLHGWARMAGSRIWSNWAALAACVREGRSARDMRGHAGFTELDADPRAARVFNDAMVGLTQPVAQAAATVMDWSGVSTIVDVGGGIGALAVGILERHPGLQAIVTDLPHASASAAEHISARGLSDRCRFIAGDFFAAVPGGGDVYLLKSVLHNWPDDRAGAILAACRKAAPRAARIAVLERIEPAEPGVDAVSREVARSDLNMLVGCGGRERTAGEFGALLRAAGFVPRRVVALANGFHAIEATAA